MTREMTTMASSNGSDLLLTGQDRRAAIDRYIREEALDSFLCAFLCPGNYYEYEGPFVEAFECPGDVIRVHIDSDAPGFDELWPDDEALMSDEFLFADMRASLLAARLFEIARGLATVDPILMSNLYLNAVRHYTSRAAETARQLAERTSNEKGGDDGR
jgi:hypothetical protein